MKNILNIIILLFLCTSCQDFLEEVPKNDKTLEYAITDAKSARAAITGMYATIQEPYLGGEMAGYLSAKGGFFKYLDREYFMSYTQEDQSSIWIAWKQWYGCVNAANAVIEGVESLGDDKFASVKEKNGMLAEAKCFRAFAYHNLFFGWSRWFDGDDSPYGLVYRDQTVGVDNLYVSRISVGESYEKIFEDLDFAIANGPDFTSSLYVSKQLAEIIKAKTLIYRGKSGDYQNALNLLLNVKSSGVISLETDLANLAADNWYCKEVLWSRYLEEGSGIQARGYKEGFYSFFLALSHKFQPTANDWLMNDPRKDVVFGDWAYSFVFGQTLIKLTHTNSRFIPAGANDPYATYYFRYAELLLLEAEMKARLTPGDLNAAIEPLNELRSRTNPVMKPFSSNIADDPNTYEIIANHDELMDAIFKEIWTELCLENGSEFYASLRFMKDGQPWIYTLKPDAVFTEDNYPWPIPNDEFISNPAIEGFQNPGLQ